MHEMRLPDPRGPERGINIRQRAVSPGGCHRARGAREWCPGGRKAPRGQGVATVVEIRRNLS